MPERFDVVVIGAGPAGIAAAIGARSAGAEHVLLVDRDRWLGGILKQCVHAGFGAFNFDAELTGPEYAERYIRQLQESDVVLALQTSVVKAGRDGSVTLSSSRRGLWTVEAAAIVLAMGCREKTRGNARIPGTRPAGIFTAGTAQRLINVDGLMVGRDVVVVGSGDVGLIMARRCTLEGARVHAVIERMPYAGGCGRNVVQCLDDFGIPLYLGHAITAIHGAQRVEEVEFAPTAGEQCTSEGQRLECDTLLFSVGLTPEIELVRQLEVPLDPRTGGPIVDGGMQTMRDGVFACGNLVQAYDIADWVSNDGERAGRCAARFASGIKPARSAIRLTPGTGVRSLVPQILSESGEGTEMSIYCRVDARYKAPRFSLLSGERVLGVIEKNFAVPGEMVALDRAALLGGERPVGDLCLQVEGSAMKNTHLASVGGPTREEAGAERRIRCIVCPASCSIRARDAGGALALKGAGCEKGRRYAAQEFNDPRRLFTSVAGLLDGDAACISVRSRTPIRREDWRRAADIVGSVTVRAPVRCGQILIPEFLEHGNSLIATRSTDT